MLTPRFALFASTVLLLGVSALAQGVPQQNIAPPLPEKPLKPTDEPPLIANDIELIPTMPDIPREPPGTS